jgi:hypothetical protein
MKKAVWFPFPTEENRWLRKEATRKVLVTMLDGDIQ